ncbi:MAG: hypothetical protein M3439_13215 [Chloroflexota bacterium]|nr:hypothetical protein [Chloroflexota bacterium]
MVERESCVIVSYARIDLERIVPIVASWRSARIEGNHEREARRYGAFNHARHPFNDKHLPVFFPNVAHRLSDLHNTLGTERFGALLADGASKTIDDAIALALRDTDN